MLQPCARPEVKEKLQHKRKVRPRSVCSIAIIPVRCKEKPLCPGRGAVDH